MILHYLKTQPLGTHSDANTKTEKNANYSYKASKGECMLTGSRTEVTK